MIHLIRLALEQFAITFFLSLEPSFLKATPLP